MEPLLTLTLVQAAFVAAWELAAGDGDDNAALISSVSMIVLGVTRHIMFVVRVFHGHLDLTNN